MKLRFLVNDDEIRVEAWPGRPALDFIREDLGLKGTKEGCREGDCGACAVLLGERLPDGGLRYRATPSCLLALGELEGRHLLTIEGLASGAREAFKRGIASGAGDASSDSKVARLAEGLTPVMQALLEENGSQCGFCSPGIVISLTGYLLAGGSLDEAGAIVAVEGNLCRCTGYGAIRRAARRLVAEFSSLPQGQGERIKALVAAGVIPSSVADFAAGSKLAPLAGAPIAPAAGPTARDAAATGRVVVTGGGSDYYVRNPDPDADYDPRLLDLEPAYAGIEAAGGGLDVGAATTVHDFFASPLVRSLVPGIEGFEAAMASSLIRSRATLGGNVANASPVGDMTAILLALGAITVIEKPRGSGKPDRRELPLERLFLGYKKLDLGPGEVIARFRLPRRAARFSFEKVSKRERLDIASVNTAASIEVDGEAVPRIVSARVSAGGVAPTPILLEATAAFLSGKNVNAATVREAARLAAGEISPISDVRGSADYRRRLLERLVMAHFIRLFPETGIAQELFP